MGRFVNPDNSAFGDTEFQNLCRQNGIDCMYE